MERLMDTIINVQEVQAELDRAARDARSGPVDVRAGRFVHKAAAKMGGGNLQRRSESDQREPID
jgi:hypothetical protein